MVGNVVPKQRRENSAPPPLASKAAGLPRRALENTKKKDGVGLADLRDVDKAKVARLINHEANEFCVGFTEPAFVSDLLMMAAMELSEERSQQCPDEYNVIIMFSPAVSVMMAFKEIQRLKELLEQERSAQEALVSKLQQQNHEVAAEVSQLRLKLASLQLISPLPSQKVYLHPGRRASLSPIREAEYSEAESDLARSPGPESNAETTSTLRERENQNRDFTAASGGKDNSAFNKSEGTEQNDKSVQLGECQASYSQANNDAESRGKENKDPELLPQWKGDTHIAKEEDPVELRKRPPPRPLPDLLSNILHRCRDAADQPESSVKYVSEGDALNGFVPILQGNLNPTVSQFPQASSSQGLHDVSTGLCEDHSGCTFHVTCSQAAVPPFATSVNLDGHEYATKPEAGGKDVLGSKHLEGGRQHEALDCVVHSHCKCTAFHQCLPNCLQRLPSSNLTNAPCSEQLGGSEKARTSTCNHEDLIEPKTCASQKKLRFDPTAGEEGIFYYASDIEKTAKENPESAPLLPTGPEERQGVQVRGKQEPLSLNMSSVEGQRPDRETLESRWTPEAIERRNSFHRIPVVSPRSTNSNEQRRLFSGGLTTKITENEGGREVSHAEEQMQLTASDCEAFSIRNEKSHPPESRRSSCRTSTCINCSSIVLRKSKRPPKVFTKFPRRCSKCSSIFEPKVSTNRLRENEAYTGRMTRSDKRSPKGKPSRHNLGSSIEKSECGPGEDFNVSDQSTQSSSRNGARCGKWTSRLKSMQLLSPKQKPKRGRVGKKTCVQAEEVSDPASVVYCIASEDMYMSTPSSTDYSIKARRHGPCSPLKVCRIHTRKMKNKRERVRESVKLLGDQSSEPREEVFHVNREILNMLLNSDGKSRGQLKAPLADSTECRIETWRFGKSHNSPKELAEEELEQAQKASSGSLARHQLLDRDLDPRRGLTLSRDGCQRARRYDHLRGREQGSEKWKNFEVDDLLDRFIQSNAECAAELIKCSVYFDSTSTSSRPSSQSTRGCENPSEGKLPFQNATAAEQGFEKGIVAPESVHPSELFRVDHNGFTSAQPCPGGSVRCSKCGVCLNPGTRVPPVDAIEMVERMELRDLCDTCSASVTPEKIKAVRRSDEITQPAGVPPPIVLPRGNSDDPLNLREAGRQQKSLIPLITTVKRSWDWVSETVHDPANPFSEEYRMPIITGVAVSSRRSMSLSEKEEAETAKELTEMFDMSLYDLVNDLEGQRRDYWRKVNCHSLDEGRKMAKDCNSRRRMVDVDKVQRSSTMRRSSSRKQVQVNHFR